MIGPEFPQVLSAAARGDEEAFARLWHDLQPRVLRYFAVVSPAAAEDLASETWLGVVRGIERFRGTEPAFRAWVFTIARHEALDWWRRAARMSSPRCASPWTRTGSCAWRRTRHPMPR